jgi:hypothetical protein
VERHGEEEQDGGEEVGYAHGAWWVNVRENGAISNPCARAHWEGPSRGGRLGALLPEGARMDNKFPRQAGRG